MVATDDLGAAAMGGDWSVYLLWCAGDRLYTGISNQPDKRFLAHSQGKGAKFTRMHPPQSMKIVACCCSKGLALSLERRLKQHTAAQKRALWAQLPLACSLATAEEASP